MATSAQKMRAYKGPKIFEKGFRPFFLSAGVFAAIAMPLWVLMLAFDVELVSPLVGRSWHMHEMLFGYLAAVIAGFLLTAVPNWTGRLPVVGWPLALLWSVWLAGRLAMMFLQGAPVLAAIIDSAFLVLFAAVLWREIIAGNNKKNVPVCVIISLLALANITFHVLWLSDDSTAFPERLGLGVIAILITLIGGRIVPSFTRNWMMRNKIMPMPTGFDKVDKAGLAIAVVAIVSWIVLADHIITGILFALACVAFIYRISRWRGFACTSEWLVLVLHVGYLWLPVWFALMAVSIFFPDFITATTALHALSAGAIGTMTIAVVTRASLGHSGQLLTANFWTRVIYILIIAGAIIRIITDWLPLDFTLTATIAGTLWSAGFAVFVLVYGPILLGRK
ncbi:MAG TPA: NnrS family protein [Rhizobiales bacterium]|nr:NnrS family protein [Hyphomicrobiales bacterium]